LLFDILLLRAQKVPKVQTSIYNYGSFFRISFKNMETFMDLELETKKGGIQSTKDLR
jgi:hypothetical protein